MLDLYKIGWKYYPPRATAGLDPETLCSILAHKERESPPSTILTYTYMLGL